MDIMMDYKGMRKKVEDLGFEGVKEHFEKKYKTHFFNISTEWYEKGEEDRTSYICKLEGDTMVLRIFFESRLSYSFKLK